MSITGEGPHSLHRYGLPHLLLQPDRHLGQGTRQAVVAHRVRLLGRSELRLGLLLLKSPRATAQPTSEAASQRDVTLSTVCW